MVRAVGSDVREEESKRGKKKRRREEEKDAQVVPIIEAFRCARPNAFSQEKMKTKHAPKPLKHRENT